MIKKILSTVLVFSFCLFLGAGSASAKDKPINSTTLSGTALHGYDAVAYFTEHKPVEGKKDFSYEWQGATWRFSTEANLALFKASPEKYAPQFGGYCAYGASKNKLVDIDPQAWEIVNDKLYLNYNKKVQETWQKDREGYIAQANKNFPQLVEPAK